MTAFVGRTAFAAPVVDARPHPGSFPGEAFFSGCIMFVHWDRADVARLLPPELELAPNVSATPHVHPVVFVFGEQARGRLLIGALELATGRAYREFALAVPFVKRRDGRYLHVYVPRMYATVFPEVWYGNEYYGLGKQTARIRWEESLFVMTTDAGRLLAHGALEASGEWSAGATFDAPAFHGMRDTFALPVVGRRSDGTFVGSWFDWDFAVARVRPATAWLSLDVPLIDGLSPREANGLATATFEVRDMRWRLSWPSACCF